MKTIKVITDVFDSLEPIFFGLLAAVVMILLPVFLVAREWKRENEILAVSIALGIVAIVGLAIKEIKKGSLGWVSGSIFGVWIVLSFYLAFIFERSFA